MDSRSENAKQRLMEKLGDVKAVMLGVEGSSDHFQPMAPHLDEEDGSIWFFTRKSSDLVATVGQGVRAHMIVVGPDSDFHACCAGALSQHYDPQKRDELWSASVDAWYAGGKEDPDLTMLRLVPSDAAVWVSEKTGISFAWEIMKANLSEREADAGWRAHIRF